MSVQSNRHSGWPDRHFQRQHGAIAHSERQVPDELITVVRLMAEAIECPCGLLSKLPNTWEFLPDIIIEE